MSRPSTRLGRRLLWIVGAFLALIVAAWAVLAAAFPPARVRGLVEGQIAGALARDVRFTGASLGLWPPVRLTVSGPELAEPGGFSTGVAFRARAIHLDLDLFALLGRRVVVHRLVLDHPAVHLVRHPDGTTNLDGIARPTDPSRARPMDLDLKAVEIASGRVAFDDPRAGRRVTFEVESRLRLLARGGGARLETSGDTRIGALAHGPLDATRLEDLNASLADLTFRIEHAGVYEGGAKRLALERLALRLGEAEALFRGVVDEPGPRARLDLRARGSRVELAQVLGFLAAADAKALHGIEGSGRLDFDLAIRGALAGGKAPALIGTLAIAEGAFRYPGAAAAVRALSLSARFAPDSLAIGNLTAVVSEASDPRARGIVPVRGSAVVTRFADPQVGFALQGPLELSAIAPLLVEKGARLAGRADLEVRGRGPARDPGAIALAGRARFAGVTLESPSLPRRIEKAEADVEFSPARAIVRGLRLTAGQSSLAIEATVARPLALAAKVGGTPPAAVSFTLESPHLDLDELLPVAPGAPLLPNAEGEGSVRIGRLRREKLDVADVAARVAMTPRRLEVPSYSFRGYGGAVRGRAAFDLAEPARPAFDVKAQVDSVLADELLSAWTPARGLVQGTLDMTIDLSGRGRSPEDIRRTLEAVGLGLVSDGTLGPVPALQEIAKATGISSLHRLRYRDLRIPLRVQHGRVITDQVVIEGGSGRWQVAGSVGFDGSLDYAVSATLPAEIASALGGRGALAAGALTDSAGNLLLDLRITGPAKAPRVAWDSRAVRDRVAGKLSRALEEQRDRLREEVRAGFDSAQRSAADSAQAELRRLQRAARDSLEKRAGDVLRGLFGRGRGAPPADTARR